MNSLTAIDLDRITNEGTRQAVQVLLALVEPLLTENAALRAENWRLKDEINSTYPVSFSAASQVHNGALVAMLTKGGVSWSTRST